MSRWADAGSFLKKVFSEFGEDDCPSMAAALAYYIVFSLAPVLLLVTAIAGLFLTPHEASRAIQEQFQYLIGAQGAEQIATVMQNAQSDGGRGVVAKIVGIAAVVFGATGVMVQLQAALNRAWGVKPNPHQGIRGFVLKRMLSFAMILGIAFLLLVSLVLSAVATAIAKSATWLIPDGLSGPAMSVVDFSVSFLVIALLFAAIYKILPDARIRWRDVAVGSVVTALLFSVGKLLIGLYLGNSDVGSTYGAASSLAILFVWVYYSSMIVLLGAEFTQVWTTRFGAGLEPERGAVVVEQKEKIVATAPPAR